MISQNSIGIVAAIALCSAALDHAAETNPAANGSFEESAMRAGVPDDWASAGNNVIRQRRG